MTGTALATRARHAAVHELLGQGVGLLECARRLGWALNNVKRYARATTVEKLQRPPCQQPVAAGKCRLRPSHPQRLEQSRPPTCRRSCALSSSASAR